MMAKWTVILTAIALRFFGVLSQTEIASSPTFLDSSPENNTQFSTSLNVTEMASRVDYINTTMNNLTTTFPPLIHDLTPKPASLPTSTSTESTTEKMSAATEKVKTVSKETDINITSKNTDQPSTTKEPNSSNMLRGSFIIPVGILVCRFGF